MEEREKRVDEADFFVGDRAERGERGEDDGSVDGMHGAPGPEAVRLRREGCALEEGDQDEWEVSGEEEGETLREVVVPVISTIEDSKILGDVEAEPFVWRKYPISVV